MHTVVIGGHWIVFEIYDVRVLGHGTYPRLFHGIIPWIPEHLVVTDRRSCSHWQAHPVGLYLILYTAKCPFHIFGGKRILRLKVLMKHAYSFVGIIFLSEIQNKIQQKSAVLSSRKGNENIVKFLKQKTQTLHRCLVYVLFRVLFSHLYRTLTLFSIYSLFILYLRSSHKARRKAR